MDDAGSVAITSARGGGDEDAELEALLHRVYVDEGFTPADLAVKVFATSAVRARGDLLCARDTASGALVGMVIVVPPNSPARRLAADDEVEMHLLAVRADQRGRGVGARLVKAALLAAKQGGWRRMVLWTQPSMHAAQRLYASQGFERAPDRDAIIQQMSGREFLVFQKAL